MGQNKEIISSLLKDEDCIKAWQNSPGFHQQLTLFADLLIFILPILAREALAQEEKNKYAKEMIMKGIL